MNFTTYFYCECPYEFQQAVHEEMGTVITQCARCMHLEAVPIQEGFAIVCQTCDYTEELTGDLSSTENKICEQCGIKGTIGYTQGDQQFVLEMKSTPTTCGTCRKGELKEKPEGDFVCPYCRKPLKQKMSSFWTNQKNEQERE